MCACTGLLPLLGKPLKSECALRRGLATPWDAEAGRCKGKGQERCLDSNGLSVKMKRSGNKSNEQRGRNQEPLNICFLKCGRRTKSACSDLLFAKNFSCVKSPGATIKYSDLQGHSKSNTKQTSQKVEQNIGYVSVVGAILFSVRTNWPAFTSN